MAVNTQIVGRVNTALVFRDDNQRAVISVIIVRRRKPSRRRLRFLGTVEFSKSIKGHIKNAILPIIDSILRQLELPKRNFEISAVNLGAASALDIGVKVSGLSADVPVFVAMLSAALQIPIINDFVATGHIASVEGDISAVKGIPAKAEAAKNDGSIKRFIYPDLEKDESLKVLSLNQRDRSIVAIMAARESIRTSAVSDIGQLTRQVFNEENIVLASLKEGFFRVAKKPDRPDSPIQEAISFLINDNEKRFWDILQQYFLVGKCGKGKELLRAFADFYIDQQVYPTTPGARLFHLVCSLPPAIRQLKMDFPILDTELCFKLSWFARKNEHEDTLRLLDAAHGKNIAQKTEIFSVEVHPETKTTDLDCRVFDTVTAQISQQALAQKFGIPIDSARGSYILSSSTVKTYEDFIDTLQAFYIHLKNCLALSPAEFSDVMKARSEAIALLEKAFYDKGGDQAAFARARDGTEGGMRSILDTLTEQYKAEKQGIYIQRVFKDAINSMEWDERVKFIRGAMKRLELFLPEEFKDEPPERFVRSYETIVRAYVSSLDKVKQLLRRM